MSKKLKEIFPSNFKLVVDSADGYKYSYNAEKDFSVKSVAGDKVIAEKKGALNYKLSEYIQNDYGGVHEYKSLGDLVSLDLNVAHYDDFVGSNYFEKEGFVVMDKDLNVAYKSEKGDYDGAKLIANQTAVLKLLYKYGPCALAHTHHSLMKDEKFKQLIGATLDKRALKLKENNPEKIQEEVAQVKEVLKYLEQQNQKYPLSRFVSSEMDR